MDQAGDSGPERHHRKKKRTENIGFNRGHRRDRSHVGAESATVAVASVETPLGANQLDALRRRLAQAPRRRDFKTVPMILNHQEQWDYEALTEVLSYLPAPRQAWDNTDIGGSWLNLMRNALNSQIWSFKHPDFLAVSVTHGTAQLALYDQVIWDKYRLTDLAGDEFKTNILITSGSRSR
jgi:hypothetical protein